MLPGPEGAVVAADQFEPEEELPAANRARAMVDESAGEAGYGTDTHRDHVPSYLQRRGERLGS